MLRFLFPALVATALAVTPATPSTAAQPGTAIGALATAVKQHALAQAASAARTPEQPDGSVLLATELTRSAVERPCSILFLDAHLLDGDCEGGEDPVPLTPQWMPFLQFFQEAFIGRAGELIGGTICGLAGYAFGGAPGAALGTLFGATAGQAITKYWFQPALPPGPPPLKKY